MSQPRLAAVAVLTRGTSSQREVLWLRRGKKVSFAPGFYAFPGGKIDDSDRQVPVKSGNADDSALIAAAAREVFEETGILVADAQRPLSLEERRELRRKLERNELTFAEILEHARATLDGNDFVDAGRWVTPDFMPSRFDARFFWVELRDGHQPLETNAESIEAAWISPQEGLAKWEQGSALLHPPAWWILSVLASSEHERDAVSRRFVAPPHCKDGTPLRIEFQRGVMLAPLRTPTLPPATHTNAYILGTGERLLVDPGPQRSEDLAPLVSIVEGLLAEGAKLKAVVLTHHHLDHIGGAREIRQRFGVPLWCHERTAESLDLKADRVLREGDVIDLDGPMPMKWRILHTPGHARGHMTLVDAASRAAIVGDMVAGVGTILIDPPEGDMTEYLKQLARLRDLPIGTLYPAHGPALPDGPELLVRYLEHRAQREMKVRTALSAGALSLADVTARAYADTPQADAYVAQRSTLAILEKLVREGAVDSRDGQYVLKG